MRCTKVFMTTCVLLVIIFFVMSLPAYGVFLEKKFVVCKDNGKDVLCDSYIVKKDDYIIKLFKQRGEIAYADYPKFLKILKRLNPHIKDLNTIYPNQRITLPLKILAPDTLEGQSTGTVTIPVITITNIPQKLHRNSVEYIVHEGDCISKLIAGRFGGYSTGSYKEAVKIFKYLNPDIKNLNVIHPGQKIKLPDPAVREAAWYRTLFNEAGEIVVFEEKEEVLKVVEEVTPPVVETVELLEPAPVKQAVEKVEPQPQKPAKAPVEVKKIPIPATLKKTAKIFQAELLDKGDYFFPRQGQADFRLDLSVTPVMEFKTGLRLLFVKDKKLLASELNSIKVFWKNIKLVSITFDESLREMISHLCRLVDPNGCENVITLYEEDMTITIRGEYIFDNLEGTGKTSVTLIKNMKQNTPDSIQRYLKKKKITISDWVDDGLIFDQVALSDNDKSPSQYIALVKASKPAAIIKELASFLGFRYQENISITFPYAGFQIKTKSNLLSVSPGKEVLIDYGDLYGDAVENIETTGFRVVQIDKRDNSLAIMHTLFNGLKMESTENPTFWVAKRPKIYNTSISTRGLLVSLPSGKTKRDIFITDMSLEKDLTVYFNQAGIQIVRIKYY